MLVVSGVGILEVAPGSGSRFSSGGVDQLRSRRRFPEVELGRGEFKGVSGLRCSSLEGVCWRFG
jgi:hypothetical protein